jgi:hypothetical protein
MRKSNLRKKYIKFYGKNIPKDYEIHHIIPIHAGGNNDYDNLIPVSKKMHKTLHLDRYNKYKDFRDKVAYYMIGYNFTKAHKITASEGGKIGGNKVKKLKIGICTDNIKNRKKWASLGGKAAQKTLKEKQISAFYDPKLRKEISSKGGKKGAFTQSKWQSEFGKRGGVKNKGFKWYTDGIKNFKYTKKEQNILSFNKFIKKNPQFRPGHCIKRKAKNEN